MKEGMEGGSNRGMGGGKDRQRVEFMGQIPVHATLQQTQPTGLSSSRSWPWPRQLSRASIWPRQGAAAAQPLPHPLAQAFRPFPWYLPPNSASTRSIAATPLAVQSRMA